MTTGKILLILTLLAPSGEVYMHREVTESLTGCFDRAHEIRESALETGLSIEYGKCLRLQPEVML